MPVSTPDALIVATEVLELVHVAPAVVVVSTIDEPSHTVDGPLIAPGRPFTVTSFVVRQPVAVTV